MLLLVLSTQCKPDETFTGLETQEEISGIRFGEEFTVQRNEQVILVGEDVPKKLYVEVKEVIDSRCPADVNCVQYGSANVIISLSNSQGKNDNVSLCIGSCNNAMQETHTLAVEIGQTSYRISLKQVSPYPGTGGNNEELKVKLIVNRIH